jgi:hypothetical protein
MREREGERKEKEEEEEEEEERKEERKGKEEIARDCSKSFIHYVFGLPCSSSLLQYKVENTVLKEFSIWVGERWIVR